MEKLTRNLQEMVISRLPPKAAATLSATSKEMSQAVKATYPQLYTTAIQKYQQHGGRKIDELISLPAILKKRDITLLRFLRGCLRSLGDDKLCKRYRGWINERSSTFWKHAKAVYREISKRRLDKNYREAYWSISEGQCSDSVSVLIIDEVLTYLIRHSNGGAQVG